MTLFYLKWEEFFGAWLEKHGQSILIVYGLQSALSLISSTLVLNGINCVCESVISSSSSRVLLQVSFTVQG